MKYHIQHQIGRFMPGDVKDERDFPAGTDFDHLLKCKAVFPTEGPLPPVGNPEQEDWKRRAEHLEVEASKAAELTAHIAELEAKNEALQSAIPTSRRGLESLSVDQLKVLVDHRGLTAPEGATKADLLAALSGPEDSGEAEDGGPKE